MVETSRIEKKQIVLTALQKESDLLKEISALFLDPKKRNGYFLKTTNNTKQVSTTKGNFHETEAIVGIETNNNSLRNSPFDLKSVEDLTMEGASEKQENLIASAKQDMITGHEPFINSLRGLYLYERTDKLVLNISKDIERRLENCILGENKSIETLIKPNSKDFNGEANKQEELIKSKLPSKLKKLHDLFLVHDYFIHTGDIPYEVGLLEHLGNQTNTEFQGLVRRHINSKRMSFVFRDYIRALEQQILTVKEIGKDKIKTYLHRINKPIGTLDTPKYFIESILQSTPEESYQIMDNTINSIQDAINNDEKQIHMKSGSSKYKLYEQIGEQGQSLFAFKEQYETVKEYNLNKIKEIKNTLSKIKL